MCSDMSTCDICSTWTKEQWTTFRGRRTYAEKKEKARTRSMSSSASAVVPSRQPSNLATTSRSHSSPEYPEHQESSHRSCSHRHKKKKKKHHRHRSSDGASHHHRTSSRTGHRTSSRTGHSRHSEGSGRSAHNGHSGHPSPDGQPDGQSGHPSPDTLCPDPDPVLRTTLPNRTCPVTPDSPDILDLQDHPLSAALLPVLVPSLPLRTRHRTPW